MLTQIVRYGRMLKADIDSARCHVKAHWTSEGSVFAGTISSTCHSVEIHTEVESDDDPALIAALIQNAQGGCYADSALTTPVPVVRTTSLNGEALSVEEYPRRVKRR
ncbi:MAG: hypothetical protein ACLFWM_03645 [Actinomycetota bacterium]